MNAILAVLASALHAAAPTHEVRLATGEVLRGDVVERGAGVVVFQHPVLGRLEIPADGIVEVRELGPEAGSPAAPPPAGPATPQQQALLQAIFAEPAEAVKPEWKSRVDVGLTGKEGVTQELNARLGLNTSVRLPGRYFYRWENTYYGGTDSGDTTDNKFNSSLLGEWPYPGRRWGFFGQAVYDFDQFQSWRHRATLGGGLTYLLVDVDRVLDRASGLTDGVTLTGRLGVNARKEWGSVNEDVQPELLIGAELAWVITRRQRVEGRGTLYPDLDDNGEFRFVGKAEWLYDLEVLDGLKLAVGADYEYQSVTDAGVSPHDLKYYVSLVLDF